MSIRSYFEKTNYKIGFSLIGIVAVVLIMFPNIIYSFFASQNDILIGNTAGFWLWNILENVGRFGIIITLCFVINKTESTKKYAVMIVAICSLISYYALWVIYFIGTVNGLVFMGLAIFPSIFFISIACKQKNKYAIAFGILFAIMHISITGSNLI